MMRLTHLTPLILLLGIVVGTSVPELTRLPCDLLRLVLDEIKDVSDQVSFTSACKETRELFPLVAKQLDEDHLQRFFNNAEFREAFMKVLTPETPLKIFMNPALIDEYMKNNFENEFARKLDELSNSYPVSIAIRKGRRGTFSVLHENASIFATKLKNVHEFHFNGGLFFPYLTGFEGFKDLKVLNLDGAYILDLAGIQNFPGLEKLYLSDTRDGDVPSSFELLGRLKKLQVLDLHSVKITEADLTAISDLTELRELNLKETKVRSLAALKAENLRNLETLKLEFLDERDVELIARLPKLKKLEFNKTNVKTDDIKKATAPMMKLKHEFGDPFDELKRSKLRRGA